MWAVTSLVVTFTTYTLLYWNELSDFAARTPSMLQTLNYKRFQVFFLLLAYGIRVVTGAVVVLVAIGASIALLLAGLGIRFWGLPTTKGFTLLISLSMAIGTTGIIMIFTISLQRLRRHREGYVPIPLPQRMLPQERPRPPLSQRVPPEELFATSRRATYKAQI